MAAPAISLRGVSKSYGLQRALDAVTFEVRPGEAVGYLGPNGAGKSTTLRLLVGASRPDEGIVELSGESPTRDRTRALAGVGALIETPGVAGYLHGRDLLAHAAAVRGVPPARRTAAILDAATRMGVTSHLDRPIGGLSTGLVRRTLIAVALLGDPSVLLLDEPTLGLDPAARRDLRDLLLAERRAGRTVLLSTHLLDDVEAVCDRVLFLRDGRIVGDEPVRGRRPGDAPSGLRRLVVQVLGPPPPETVRTAAGPDVRADDLGGGEWRFEFTGDDRAQSELIARLVGARIPVVRASGSDSELGRRYLEVVGREGSE